MAETYNIYLDESCHLEHDDSSVMTLGAIWCPQEKARSIAVRIRDIQMQHGLDHDFEVKWTKVSPAKYDFYQTLLDYFLDDDDLHFRGIVIPDKNILEHQNYNQSHDEWYYKMCFQLLEPIIDPTQHYAIYLDIKDTRSENKRKSLEEVLRSAKYDGAGNIVRRVQQIRSHESELMQLADLIIGIVTYANRGLTTSTAKLKLVERLRERKGFFFEKLYMVTRTQTEFIGMEAKTVTETKLLDWLPEIIALNDYEGDWQIFIDAVYSVFEADFINSKSQLRGNEVGVRREKSYDGKWFTFWHCVSEGEIEEDRTPDLRRCERVPWIKPVIENETDESVDVWTTKKKREERLYLWLNEEYIIVLSVRKGYYLLITAFPTNRNHTVAKLRRERDSCQV